MKSARWLHPIHSRGLRSTGIPTLRGKLLTDKRIKQLILQGAYGEEMRSTLLAQTKKAPTAEQANKKMLRKLGIKL